MKKIYYIYVVVLIIGIVAAVWIPEYPVTETEKTVKIHLWLIIGIIIYLVLLSAIVFYMKKEFAKAVIENKKLGQISTDISEIHKDLNIGKKIEGIGKKIEEGSRMTQKILTAITQKLGIPRNQTLPAQDVKTGEKEGESRSDMEILKNCLVKEYREIKDDLEKKVDEELKRSEKMFQLLEKVLTVIKQKTGDSSDRISSEQEAKLREKEEAMLHTYNNNNPEKFEAQYKPRRVAMISLDTTAGRAVSSSKDPEFEERDSGIFLIIEEKNRDYLLPQFGAGKYELSQIGACFEVIGSPQNKPFKIKETKESAICTKTERGWILEKKGKLIAEE